MVLTWCGDRPIDACVTSISIVPDAVPSILQALASYVKVEFVVDDSSGHADVRSAVANIYTSEESLLAEIDLLAENDIDSYRDAVLAARIELKVARLDLLDDDDDWTTDGTYALVVRS